MQALPRETVMKRIRMRANHRGMKEMDIILGRFSETELDGASDAALAEFETLMEENDQEIYGWILGRARPPRKFEALINRIARHAGAR